MVTDPSVRLLSLIPTKLYAPVARPLLPREELFEVLRARPGVKLTLVCAPAGWGKSSLLAAWAAVDEPSRPFAWFAIDEADNDPVRFWVYLIEALRTVQPVIGAHSLALLRASGTGLTDLVVAELINEVAALGSPMVLALDDYHLIEEPEIHRSLALLVEHLPEVLHVAIATRGEPCLPVARLRARGELTEINAAALGFSDEEADRFLNEFLGLALPAADIRILRERTEGWAAGLYLAALSLHDRGDRHEFITQFAGDHRHIVDYLWAEVLTSLDTELYTFLLHTSILGRLCAPLCDAVTGTSGSAARLREIERSNLFLVPLDATRQWYRYHHLFRDLLRHELATAGPGRIPGLHRRAAHWLLQAGHVSDAIHHTIAAGDHGRACELIATYWVQFLAVGDHGTILSWLQALPEDAPLGDARVCVAGAFVSLSTGHLEQTEPWLDRAQHADVPGPFMDDCGSLAAASAFVRMGHRLGIGVLHEARDFALEAIDLLEKNSTIRPVAFSTLGLVSYFLGHTQKGIDALEEGLNQMQGRGVGTGHAMTHGWLATIRADLQQWDKTDELASRGIAVGTEMGDEEFYLLGFSHVARGRVMENRGQFDRAEASLSRGVQLLRRGFPIFLCYVLPIFARFKHSRGQGAEARTLIREARSVVETFPDPGILPQLIEQMERRLRLIPSRQTAPLVEELTPKEFSVLRLLASTLSQREIAGELYVSMNTVKSHTKSIFRKLGVSTRLDAVSRARELGLI